jgi:hypothetical protein
MGRQHQDGLLVAVEWRRAVEEQLKKPWLDTGCNTAAMEEKKKKCDQEIG